MVIIIKVTNDNFIYLSFEKFLLLGKIITIILKIDSFDFGKSNIQIYVGVYIKTVVVDKYNSF